MSGARPMQVLFSESGFFTYEWNFSLQSLQLSSEAQEDQKFLLKARPKYSPPVNINLKCVLPANSVSLVNMMLLYIPWTSITLWACFRLMPTV